MNSNLVPEQRSDKNGNVVTRWVRGMFGRKESSRPIPKVDLVGSSGMTKRDAKALRDQMLARFDIPKKPLTLEALRDMEESQMGRAVYGMADRSIIERAYQNENYTGLLLMERFGETHGYNYATMAGSWLVRGNLEGEVFNITREKLDAFKSFSDIANEVTNDSEKDEDGKPVDLLNMSPLFSHVLMHPEDEPALSKIVGRGVVDPDEAFDILAVMKTDSLHPVVSEGSL